MNHGSSLHLQREALRLVKTTNMSNRAIGRQLGIAFNTVRRYRSLLTIGQLSYEKIEALDDAALSQILHPGRRPRQSKRLPDWTYIRKELQRRDVTLQLLWEEYCLSNPHNAYSYSQFTQIYREFVGKLSRTMRQMHHAGECAFVDFAGHTIRYIDPKTGAVHTAQIFVGVLGCSNYTFAYAVASQTIFHWIDAHNRMLVFFGGSPSIVVPDNLKAAVIRAGREPVLNRAYLEQARHYKFVIVQTRPRHPRDKAKVEVAVQVVSRWILARLRKRKFFSIAEINAAIAELLTALNNRPFRRLSGTRRSWFEELDRPMLRPLPAQPFEYAEWTSSQKIAPDYHIHFRKHYYSVPHALVGERVDVRATKDTVEIFYRNRRVATHCRNFVEGGHTTDATHRPEAHRLYAEQTPERYRAWAKTIGDATVAVVERQFVDRPHAALGIRACSALQHLGKEYGAKRLEGACRRAQAIGSPTVTSVKSILRRGLDHDPKTLPTQISLPLHHNVRGANYYSPKEI